MEFGRQEDRGGARRSQRHRECDPLRPSSSDPLRLAIKLHMTKVTHWGKGNSKQSTFEPCFEYSPGRNWKIQIRTGYYFWADHRLKGIFRNSLMFLSRQPAQIWLSCRCLNVELARNLHEPYFWSYGAHNNAFGSHNLHFQPSSSP